MEQKRLLTTEPNELRAQNKQAKLEANLSHNKLLAEAIFRAAAMKRFKSLQKRNSAVVQAMHEITNTSLAETLDVSDGVKRSIPIVIARHSTHSKSSADPAHVKVCCVSSIYPAVSNHLFQSVFDRTRIQFGFAIIPQELLDRFIKSPEDLLTSDTAGVVLHPPEEALSEYEWLQEMKDLSGLDGLSGWNKRRQTFSIMNSQVTQLESSLAIVSEAMANPQLNPHLQPQSPMLPTE